MAYASASRWLNFPRTRCWVAPSAFGPYLAHQLFAYRKCKTRRFLRSVWSPNWRRPDEHVSALIEVARDMGLQVSWVCHPTPSTRNQVFDVRNGWICKISKPGYDRIRHELAIRQSLQSAPVPAIVRIAPNHDAFVEQWSRGHVVPLEAGALDAALTLLELNLYHTPRLMSFDEFLALLRRQGTVDEGCKRAIEVIGHLIGKRRLPVCLVHGDLASGNVIRLGPNKIEFIDWEYVRECVLSYDAWLACYCCRLRSGSSHNKAWPVIFHRDFRRTLERPFFVEYLSGFDPNVLHLIHLLERLTFLNRLDQDTTLLTRKSLHDDIRHQIQSF